MNILLRCDYGAQTGLGHLKRSSVLLSALAEAEDEVYLVDYRAEVNLPELLDSQGLDFATIKLTDLAEMIAFVSKSNIDLVIWDSYELGIEQEQQLKAATQARLLVLDDLFKPHFCDYLLNHNLHARKSQYEDLVPAQTQVYCGPEYSLVGAPLKAARTAAVGVQYDYFLSLGATDHRGLLPKILDLLGNAKVAVATTSLNPQLTALEAHCETQANWYLFIDHPNLGILFRQARLAIVSASALMIEAIFLNKLFIAINTVDNQSRNTQFLRAQAFPVIAYRELERLPELIRSIMRESAYYQAKVNALSDTMGLQLDYLTHELRDQLTTA